MKFRVLKDKNTYKQGEIVQLRQDFWTKYFEIKGILQPLQELTVQAPPQKRGKRGRK